MQIRTLFKKYKKINKFTPYIYKLTFQKFILVINILTCMHTNPGREKLSYKKAHERDIKKTKKNIYIYISY